MQVADSAYHRQGLRSRRDDQTLSRKGRSPEARRSVPIVRAQIVSCVSEVFG
jgi:hypothetical protein